MATDVSTADSLKMSAGKIRGLLKKSVVSIVEIGKELIEVKTILPYGDFGGWVEEELKMSRQSAQNFMQVALRFGNELSNYLTSTPTILYLLAQPGTPQEAIDEVIEAAEAGEEPSVASVKETVKKHKEKKANQKPATKPTIYQHDGEAVKVSTLADLADQKFGTIYADPPWQYGNQSTRASTDNHYTTMTLDALRAMPIQELAADDAHLHLWTTNGFLPDAFSVMEAWGFEYRSCFVWCKPQMGIGNYWRVSHEFLLLGIRGNAKRFNDHSLMSWLSADRQQHSAKPDEIRGMIERASSGPYLELFGRKIVSGWTVYGNQVDSNVLFA